MVEVPFNLGYKMPAEWERHDATWLSWPKDPETFPDGILQSVEESYANMVMALAKGEKVNVLVDDKKMEEAVKSMLGSAMNVIFHRIKSVDVWIRDYGPIFVKNSKGMVATKWIFNSWGSKYESLKEDNVTGMKVAGVSEYKIFETGVVLEGGSIDANGLGTCLTTEQCLLNENRNSKLTKKQIEKKLKDYLGFTNVIWLKEGIVGDDTGGHVDDIARFVNKNTILCAIEKNPKDENYEILQTNLEILKDAGDQDDKGFVIVELPMPRKIEIPERRLPASYANFYIGNSAVLVPTFDDKNDKKAMGTIGEFFPDRDIIGISSKDLVYGYGGIHCVTQQQPAI